jgi:hypothetical protein
MYGQHDFIVWTVTHTDMKHFCSSTNVIVSQYDIHLMIKSSWFLAMSVGKKLPAYCVLLISDYLTC